METGPPIPASFRILRASNMSRTGIEDQYVRDEVFCLPHATHHPIECSFSIPLKHRGPHGALLFTFSATFAKESQSVDGMFPVPCFAIVLGISEYLWTMFVPVLRDTHADADFHEVLRHATVLFRFCMTKRQRGDTSQFQARNRQFDQLLCVWHIKPFVYYRNLEGGYDPPPREPL
ncbi:hypothetical protein RRF57_001518 [Xylaria bambusicola]|uniref:Uncharacterized protein n=1 Tax=Xylaria bambusicola TaxID=326684 RepID=A0AAN7Z0U7_9PEZI